MVVAVEVGVVVGVVVGLVVGVVIVHPTKSPYKCDSIMALITSAISLQLSLAMASTSPKHSTVKVWDALMTGPWNSVAKRLRPFAMDGQESPS